MSDDLYKKLTAPFKDDEIEWRAGSTNQKSIGYKTGNQNAKASKAVFLPYVTNRAIMNRLDEVFGWDAWSVKFREHHNGTICQLNVCVDGTWIAKEDAASNTRIEPEKGGCSDAMKRAAVQFGIGRYLYNAETEWVDIDEWGKPKKKLTLKLKTNAQKEADDFIESI